MTLKEFNDTVEIMRKAYPFTDEDTKLVFKQDLAKLEHDHISLFTKDKESDTFVTLDRNCERSEEQPWWMI